MGSFVPTVASLLGNFTAVILFAAVAGIYLLPTIVGMCGRKDNWILIAPVNIPLGWTDIAWGAMIVEAFSRDIAP